MHIRALSRIRPCFTLYPVSSTESRQSRKRYWNLCSFYRRKSTSFAIINTSSRKNSHFHLVSYRWHSMANITRLRIHTELYFQGHIRRKNTLLIRYSIFLEEYSTQFANYTGNLRSTKQSLYGGDFAWKNKSKMKNGIFSCKVWFSRKSSLNFCPVRVHLTMYEIKASCHRLLLSRHLNSATYFKLYNYRRGIN